MGVSGKERDGRGDTIPEWDGKSFSLKVYKRKVRLYEASSQTPASRRGCKLLQKLTGDACDKTDHLDPNTLVHEDGVARLLSYLEAKYEPKEAVKVGSAIDEFIERLERRPGEEIRDFDTRFESKMKELEGLIGDFNKNLKAHYFLRKLKVGGERETLVIAGAGNKYEYEALRESAISCIPRIGMLGRTPPPPTPGAGFHSSQQRRFTRKPPRRAYATEHGEPQEPEEEHEQDLSAEAEEGAAGAYHTEADEDSIAAELPDELQEALHENEVMITQAKKHRSDIEKAREFYRDPRQHGDGKDRLKALKARLPCAKCGKTGHWKDDPECPR